VFSKQLSNIALHPSSSHNRRELLTGVLSAKFDSKFVGGAETPEHLCNYPVLPTLAKNPLFMSEESGNLPQFIHHIAHVHIVCVVSAAQC
jgi:hypothetical protein